MLKVPITAQMCMTVVLPDLSVTLGKLQFENVSLRSIYNLVSVC